MCLYDKEYSNKILRENAKKIKKLRLKKYIKKLFKNIRKVWKNIYKLLSNYDCLRKLHEKI